MIKKLKKKKKKILKNLGLKKKEKKIALYDYPKGKFILTPQEQRQGPRFKVLSEGPSPELTYLYSHQSK